MFDVFFYFFRTENFSFSQFSVVFGGSGQFLTSESTSLSNFASDRPIHSSVRSMERSFGQSESRKWSDLGSQWSEEVANLATFVRVPEPAGKCPQKRRVGRTRTEALHAMRPEASADDGKRRTAVLEVG